MSHTTAHTTARSSTTTATAAQPGILVVDDNPAVLGVLRIALAQRGFRVWTAGSGAAAVELACSAGPIDVLLIDVCMPGLDGPATLAQLRQGGVRVPACFMSGSTGVYSVDELLGLGAERLFEKPFQLDTLTGEVWRLAQRKAA